MTRIALVALVGMGACSGSTTDDTGPADTDETADTGDWYFTPFPQTRTDEGTACVSAGALGVQPDEAGLVRVDIACVGCGVTVVSSSCAATVVGSELQVTATAELEVGPTPPTITCTCAPVEAECAAPPLSAGAWTLAYGGGSAPFTVPTDDQVCVNAQ